MNNVKRYRGFGGSGFEFFISGKIFEFEKEREDLSVGIYLIATADGEKLAVLAENIKSFCAFFGMEVETVVFPCGDDSPELKLKTLLSIYKRIPTADNIVDKNSPLVILSTYSALDESNIIPLAEYRKRIAVLRVGGKFPRGETGVFFEDAGYQRAAYVEDRGYYSLRGQVADFWNPAEELPRRVVLNGDIIEEIKFFDPASQLSLSPEKISDKVIYSSDENVIISVASVGVSGKKLLDGWFTARRPYSRHNEIDSMLVSLGAAFLDMSTPSDLTNSLVLSEISSRASIVYARDPLFAEQPEDNRKGDTIVQEEYEPLGFYGGDVGLLERDISSLAKDIKEKIFFYSSDGEVERFQSLLPARIFFEKKFRAHISEGFFNRKKGLFVLSARQFFLKSSPPSVPDFFKLKIPSRRLEGLWEIKDGDYVVHEKYGIGIYRGIVLMDEPPQEFIILEYKHNDKIYVPVWDFSRVKKYIGIEGVKPQVSDLDAPALWERARRKAAQSAEIFAKELLKLYAERETATAPVMSETTVWEEELADSFPFDETPDQSQAIKETLADLERPRPAERLILGDVGFGKTEVAVRAAFKAAVNSWQTAMIVPTTILAMQHYARFTERLAPFPAVKVVALHRFLSPSEKRKTLEEIGSGAADIVIGTHRILSSDVRFKKLGLLIIDEEHRFGVRHKEKLRRTARGVHTIYMSATPIPRTLASALEGLKDISLIETPPVGRKPVETFVLPYSPQKVRYAVLRELSRGGQIFYVKNFIPDLGRVFEEVSSFSKSAKWGIIHGKMKTSEIENTLYEFYRGGLDGLVATTIIESGLDIPQVNTMIIEDAQDFGLAQLYQLRGRVGRGDRNAYCYLFYDEKNLTQDAVKRIEALEIFSHGLGEGFQLARRDLEIRGAGAAFGYRQHGFVASVGFEYYSALVARAIKNLKLSRPAEERFSAPGEEPVISIPQTSAYIPRDYIEDDAVRISFYRKFLNVSSEKDLEEIKNSLIDRFGRPLPESVKNLATIASVRLLMKEKGISSVRYDDAGAFVIEFRQEEDAPIYFDKENLMRLFGAFKGELSFDSSSPHAFRIKNIPSFLRRDGNLPSSLKGLLEKILEFATIKKF